MPDNCHRKFYTALTWSPVIARRVRRELVSGANLARLILKLGETDASSLEDATLEAARFVRCMRSFSRTESGWMLDAAIIQSLLELPEKSVSARQVWRDEDVLLAAYRAIDRVLSGTQTFPPMEEQNALATERTCADEPAVTVPSPETVMAGLRLLPDAVDEICRSVGRCDNRTTATVRSFLSVFAVRHTAVLTDPIAASELTAKSVEQKLNIRIDVLRDSGSDDQAFWMRAEPIRDRLRSFVLRLLTSTSLPNRQDVADDLLNNGLVRAAAAFGRFDPGSADESSARFFGWLRRILTNEFIDLLRATRREISIEGDIELRTDDGPGPLPLHVIHALVDQRIRSAIALATSRRRLRTVALADGFRRGAVITLLSEHLSDNPDRFEVIAGLINGGGFDADDLPVEDIWRGLVAQYPGQGVFWYRGSSASEQTEAGSLDSGLDEAFDSSVPVTWDEVCQLFPGTPAARPLTARDVERKWRTWHRCVEEIVRQRRSLAVWLMHDLAWFDEQRYNGRGGWCGYDFQVIRDMLDPASMDTREPAVPSPAAAWAEVAEYHRELNLPRDWTTVCNWFRPVYRDQQPGPDAIRMTFYRRWLASLAAGTTV